MASRVSGSRSNPSFAANRIARRMRTGSSRRRSSALADGAQRPRLDVVEAAGVVEDRVFDGIVVERVDGEVPAEGVLVQGAVDVVAQQHAVRGEVIGVGLVVVVLVAAPERRHLDELAPETDVGDAETASDQAGPGEDRLDLLRGGVGRDVEVLGSASEQEIAHASPHQVSLVPGAAQAVDDGDGIRRHRRLREIGMCDPDGLAFRQSDSDTLPGGLRLGCPHRRRSGTRDG